MSRELIDKLRNNRCPISEIRRLIFHPSLFVRANALMTLGRWLCQRSETDELSHEIIEELITAAHDPENIDTELVGSTRVSYLAICCLFNSSSPPAVAAANTIVCTMSEVDQKRIDELLRDWRKLIGLSI